MNASKIPVKQHHHHSTKNPLYMKKETQKVQLPFKLEELLYLQAWLHQCYTERFLVEDVAIVSYVSYFIPRFCLDDLIYLTLIYFMRLICPTLMFTNQPYWTANTNIDIIFDLNRLNSFQIWNILFEWKYFMRGNSIPLLIA